MIGLVGTGMLGLAVGQRLLGRGYSLQAYNRTRSKAEQLRGARICGSPAEAASGAELTITAVTDSDALEEVALGPRGIASAAGGSAVLDISTVDPARERALAEKLAAAGRGLVEGPVMGGPDAALEGRLVMMASGPRDLVERHGAVLNSLASEIIYLGPSGSAHAVKLAMNVQIASLAISISEGMELARSSGVEPEKFLQVLNATYFATGMSRKKAYRMARSEYPATFTLANLAKDLGLACGHARSVKAGMPAAELARKLYSEAAEGGLGGLDYTGIRESIKREADRADP